MTRREQLIQMIVDRRDLVESRFSILPNSDRFTINDWELMFNEAMETFKNPDVTDEDFYNICLAMGAVALAGIEWMEAFYGFRLDEIDRRSIN